MLDRTAEWEGAPFVTRAAGPPVAASMLHASPMATTMQTSHRLLAPQRPRLGHLVLLLAFLAFPAPARAQERAAEGQCIAVRNPISSEEYHRLQKVSERILEQAHDRSAVKLIYDFNPGNASATASDLGPCADLARYLLSLKDVTTVAFVHGDVARHAVLPVLACKELVMSPDAKLGPAVEDRDLPVTQSVRGAYVDVLSGRSSLCEAIVFKLLYKDMDVLQGTRKGSVWYVDASREQEEREKNGVFVGNRVPVLGSGRTAVYTVADAQKYGLCKRELKGLEEVVDEYELPRSKLREYALLSQDPVAWQMTVTGPVTPTLVDSLKRRIRRAIGNPERHVNLVILQLECGGGDPAVAQAFAKWLHELKDDRGEFAVKTVAYVPAEAHDTAALVAFGCSEIVLHENATIGDLSPLAGRDRDAPEEALADENKDPLLLNQVKTFARDEVQLYPTALLRGMAYRNLTLYTVDSAAGARRSWVLTEAELNADLKKARPQWKNPRRILSDGPPTSPLLLKGRHARELFVATEVVDGLPSLYERYGLKDQVRTSGNDWLDNLVTVLRWQSVSVFLFFLGITCLVLELKMPGLGLPGVVAALCFVLLFWANAHDATITILAVLLFILGLVLIGLEVFVIPGATVFGISGALLMVSSLTLVTLDHWPQTSQEWLNLGGTLTTFGLSMMGSVTFALLLAWYLPHIPYVNRIILKPPGEAEEDGAEAAAEQQAETAALLGAVGVAATPLRPAGKVRFGDQFLDVVAEGNYVQPGSRVQVIEIEGYRIVVKEV